jgi:hypothetical protein
MSRIPAFLFYDGDAARDVAHMNRLQRGAYFDIMQAQLKFGHLTGNLIQRILGNDYDNTWEVVKIVLIQDERSCFYIQWVDESIKKRDMYSYSRSKNVSKRWENKKIHTDNTCNTHVEHMNQVCIYTDDTQETETESDIKKEEEYSKEFLQFWSVYPKKKSKGAAWKAWGKIPLPTKTLPLILSALEWQKSCTDWIKDSGQYIPHPSTYLNSRGWEDEKQNSPTAIRTITTGPKPLTSAP